MSKGVTGEYSGEAFFRSPKEKALPTNCQRDATPNLRISSARETGGIALRTWRQDQTA